MKHAHALQAARCATGRCDMHAPKIDFPGTQSGELPNVPPADRAASANSLDLPDIPAIPPAPPVGPPPGGLTTPYNIRLQMKLQAYVPVELLVI